MSRQIYDYPELIESGETLVPVSKACKELFNPPISIPTGVRHYTNGVRNAILRTVKVGGIRCTTASEVKRFLLAQLENPAPSGNEPANNVTKRSTRRTGGEMTPEEVAAGLARHGLEGLE